MLWKGPTGEGYELGEVGLCLGLNGGGGISGKGGMYGGQLFGKGGLMGNMVSRNLLVIRNKASWTQCKCPTTC